MQEPKTLLQMAGAKLEPHKIGEAALVLIDAQREYQDGKLALPGIEAALGVCAELLAAARAAGAPVIHVQHKGRPGGLFDPGATGFQLCDAVAAAEGEIRIEKGLPNAFAGTPLDAVLKKLGVKNLIVGGFMTHMCVSSSVRAGLDLGYLSTVVGPACATRDLPDGLGGVVPADTLHRAELAALGDRFAVIAASAGQVLA
jgi:nicotinamidase-related amidase